MRIRCPNCRNAIELVDDSTLTDIACPSCGSSFNLVGSDDDTETMRRDLTSLAHFRLLERLGIGAHGAVWKANDTELDRVVAIKIPRKELRTDTETELFLRDARAAAQLNHPHVVSVHEVGKEGSTLYIVSDYVEGADLAQWMGDEPLPPREAAQLMIQIAEGVDHAHEHGVIHRDLKPANVMMTRKGEPRVMDFGLAKREAGEITMTVDGATVGTPAYMSPEQAQGRAHDADARSDVYSLGVMLYEMLTGTRPFHGDKRMLLIQIQEDDPPLLRRINRSVPKDLETITLKCLRKEPNKRYPSAQELADDLGRWLKQEPIRARRVTIIEQVAKWTRRNPAVAGLSATIVLIAILFGILFWNGRNASRADGLVDALVQAEPRQVPDIIRQMEPYKAWTKPRLREVLADESESSDSQRRKLHARLALVSVDKSLVPQLKDALLIAEVQDIGNIRDALVRSGVAVHGELWDVVHAATETDARKFRAALALLALDKDSTHWDESKYQLFCDQLVAINSVFQPDLWPLLAGVRQPMLPLLEDVFVDSARPDDQRTAAANAIAFFAGKDLDRLTRLMPAASGSQYRILFEKYVRVADAKTEAAFQATMQTQPADELDVAERIELGRNRAVAAITLLRQGNRDAVFDALRYQHDPEALTQFIHRCRSFGVTAAELLDCFNSVDALRGPLDGQRMKTNDSVMYALLLALGEYAEHELPQPVQPLIDRLVKIYGHDPSSAVHSAAGWLLRTWGHHEEVRRVDQTPIDYDDTGHQEWFVREIEHPAVGLQGLLGSKQKFYLTFVVFRAGEYRMGSPSTNDDHQDDETIHRVTLSQPIAVCDRELTWAQWDACYGPRRREIFSREQSRAIDDQDPVFGIEWYDAVGYCRWLTEQAGLPEEDQCYDDLATLPKGTDGKPIVKEVYFDRHGFRLPSEAEWEYFCRSGTRTSYSFGNDVRWIGNYAQFLLNSDQWAKPVALLRPNPRGLFDVHGNQFEWCHDMYDPTLRNATDPLGSGGSPYRVLRGGSWGSIPRDCRSACRDRNVPISRHYNLGFRIVCVPTRLDADPVVWDSQ